MERRAILAHIISLIDHRVIIRYRKIQRYPDFFLRTAVMICCPGQKQLFRRHLARIFPPEIKCDLQDIFSQLTHTSPQKSNGRSLKPCLPWINCIRQAEIDRIWICSIYFGFLNCQDKAYSNGYPVSITTHIEIGRHVRINVNKGYLSFIGRRWFRLILQETQRKPSLANGTIVTRSHSPSDTSLKALHGI